MLSEYSRHGFTYTAAAVTFTVVALVDVELVLFDELVVLVVNTL